MSLGVIDLSVAIPLYNEAEVVGRLYERLKRVLDSLNIRYELIFVDDGSSDGTFRWIQSAAAKDPALKGVRLSRNFGHQTALCAGLAESKGKFVLMMDGDLQHPPELIPELWKNALAGYDIVYTVRTDERTSWFKKMTRSFFYKLFRLLSDTDLDENAADFRIISRRVCDEIVHMDERDLFLRGIIAWVGFPRKKVLYAAAERQGGKSKYGLKKMLSLFLSGITSFSVAPIRLSIILCWISLFVSFDGVVYALCSKIFFGTVAGWTSLLIFMSFFFSFIFMILAILGEYIGKIHVETKKRPRYLVEDRAGKVSS